MSEQGMFCFDVQEELEVTTMGVTVILPGRAVPLSERFHDVIVQHRNSIKVSGPAEEKFTDDYFHGLLDALDNAGLRDPRRPAKKK